MKSMLALRYTELGAIGLSLLLIYMAGRTLFFDPAPLLEGTAAGIAIEAVLAVPATLIVGPFIFYVWFHCAQSGRWLWLVGCLLMLPLELVYWWRFIRPEFGHDAQQGAPADGPASRARG